MTAPRLTVGDPPRPSSCPTPTARRRAARPRRAPRRPSSSSPPTAARTPVPGTTGSRTSPATTPSGTSASCRSSATTTATTPRTRPRRMRQRVAAGELAGPFLRDADQSVAQAYGATATPEVFVIDRRRGGPVPRRPGRRLRRPGARTRPGCGKRWTTCWPAARSPGRSPRPRAARSSGGWSCSGGRAARPTPRPPTCWRARSPTSAGARCTSSGARCAPARRPSGSASPGRPTFQVGRRDLFPTDAPPALTCRVYQREDGRSSPLPDADELAARLRAVARPPLGPAALGRPPQDEARLRRHPVLISTSPDSAGAVMASITFDKITKRYPDGTQAVTELDLEHPGRRVPRPGRAVRLRQDDRAADGGRPGGDLRRPAADRRPGGQRRAPVAARHRDGLPELRALPAHVGAREHRLPA